MIRKSFLRDRCGATAVEFAMLAAPFFILVISLIELGFVHVAQTSFERQLDHAARIIKTGEARDRGWRRRDLKSYVCSSFFSKQSCTSDLRMDVRGLSDIVMATRLIDDQLTRDGQLRLGWGDDVVLIRAELDYEPMVRIGSYSIVGGLTGEPFVFSAAAVFQNEPF